MKNNLPLIALFILFYLLGLVLGTVLFTPRLVGYGCEGSNGTLYAQEEDDFPSSCVRIERIVL